MTNGNVLGVTDVYRSVVRFVRIVQVCIENCMTCVTKAVRHCGKCSEWNVVRQRYVSGKKGTEQVTH